LIEARVNTREFYNKANRLHASLLETAEKCNRAFDEYKSHPEHAEDADKFDEAFNKQAEYEDSTEEAKEALTETLESLAESLQILSTQQATSQYGSAQEQDEVLANNLQSIHLQSGSTPLPGAEQLGESAQGETAGFQQESDAQESAEHAVCAKTCCGANDLMNKVPKFNGEATKFSEWWHVFHRYVDAQDVDAMEKCRIFKQSLTGKAAKHVCYIDISAECYQLMRDMIQKRFGNKAMAQDAHMHRIINLCKARDLMRDDRFIEFVMSVSQSVHALVASGKSFASLSLVLAPVIVTCLPERFRIRFNTLWRAKEPDGEDKLEVLISFLEDQASVMEESLQQKRMAEPGRTGPAKHNQGKHPRNFRKDASGPQQHQYAQKSQFSFAAQVSAPACIFCGKGHPPTRCVESMSPVDRRKVLAEHNSCLRCFRKNLVNRKCLAKQSNCAKCGARHHVLVCTKQRSEASSNLGSSDVINLCQPTSQLEGSETLLQTAHVWVINGKNRRMCRAILDPGSQRSFVSEKVVSALGIEPTSKETVQIHGVAGRKSDDQDLCTSKLVVKSRFSRHQINIGCLTVPRVVRGLLPRAASPRNLAPMADSPQIGFPEEIELLIGADALHLVYNGMYRKVGEYTASPTIFGWVLWGGDGGRKIVNSVVTSLGEIQHAEYGNELATVPVTKPKTQFENLNFLWDTEFLGIESSSQDEDKSSLEQMEKFFKSSIRMTPEGRFVVSLPFRENLETLGDNRNLAYSRLQGLLKSLRKNPKQLKAVDQEVARLISSRFVEPAKPRLPGQKAYYLPLVAVAKKSLASDEVKVRVVKDGAARSRDEASLNDVLEKGPNYLPDLVAVLLQFRRKPIAIVADIKAAFNQFLINENHRTFLRFFWPAGVATNPDAPIREFWATVLDFGSVCSPWLHCAGVRHHLDLQIEKRPAQAQLLREVKSTFYVDDIATGGSDVKDAKQVVSTLIDVFREGHFPLGKWKTNNCQLAEYIKEVSREENPEVSSQDVGAKFLGVSWNQQNDTLFTDTKEIPKWMLARTPSKRNLLKGLSQIYDPLGLLACLAINFKVLTQVLWTKKLDWDTPLDGELSVYRASVHNLEYAHLIRISRPMFAFGSGTAARELHVFADASLKSYGAVVYMREIPTGKVGGAAPVSFIMAKSRVCPLKGKWTIHRLELMAAVVAARLAKRVSEAVAEAIDRIFLYSDKSAVLGWLRQSSDRWKPFVANRIREIQAISRVEDWSYVGSEDNPADLLSRGSPLNTADLRQFWLQGPEWLAQQRAPESHGLNPEDGAQAMLQEKKAEILSAAAVVETPLEQVFHRRLSSWGKAVRVIAYIRRWGARCNKSVSFPSREVAPEEYVEAETVVLKLIQRSSFGAEMADISHIPKSSLIAKANPFISRNPAVTRIISDNARTFTRAEKELEAIFDNANHPRTQAFLARKRIVWSHITEKSPWHGAFWERLVQVVLRETSSTQEDTDTLVETPSTGDH
ncbi:uncharacterized protein LOC100904490, partial [Galendromus occidentalis]|uniref:Uncharacterized protein LOC100904490 n=1 Tax=Galendromus occidentalis TaxID=34638 RepID=A0AAJ6QM86_9ACAR